MPRTSRSAGETRIAIGDMVADGFHYRAIAEALNLRPQYVREVYLYGCRADAIQVARTAALLQDSRPDGRDITLPPGTTRCPRCGGLLRRADSAISGELEISCYMCGMLVFTDTVGLNQPATNQTPNYRGPRF